MNSNLSKEQKDKLIAESIRFIRVITEMYGSDKGHEAWESISNNIDPELKGEILVAILRNEARGSEEIEREKLAKLNAELQMEAYKAKQEYIRKMKRKQTVDDDWNQADGPDWFWSK